MAFRFKQFTVEDDRSTMRIGTDAVLLGCRTKPGNARSILEIGTGCGVISLMLAQKSDARIDAIEIDHDSAVQAGENFLKSPWAEKLRAVETTLQDYSLSCTDRYDLIVSNPPFFTGSLPSPDMKRNQARHSTCLTRKELLEGVSRLLSAGGSFYVIFPPQEVSRFAQMAESAGLFVQQTLNITPKAGKPVNRKICCFRSTPCSEEKQEELVIRNHDNSYTNEYIELTRSYYFSLT